MTTKVLQPEIDHDSGYFDVAGFATATLASAPALAAVFDHTLLKPEATRDQVVRLCEEAASFRFACAMVPPNVAHANPGASLSGYAISLRAQATLALGQPGSHPRQQS